MKTLLIMLLSFTLSLSASAQRHFSGGRAYSHARVYVVPSISFYGGWGIGYPYGYYGYPYGYFDYPFYAPRMYRSSKAGVLGQQINSIKTDYKYKIKAVRKDKTLGKAEKKQQILLLKSERENEIQKAQSQFLNKKNPSGPVNGDEKADTSGAIS